MLAYKAARSNGARVLITLEIPPDAITNIGRSSVACKETASYRTNKVKVLKIEGDAGVTYPSAETKYCTLKGLVYRVGEVVVDPTFDMNLEYTYSSGIHFFLSRHVAELYRLTHVTYDTQMNQDNLIQNGIYACWHENGQKFIEGMMKDGKEEGNWTTWYSNGHKTFETLFVAGKREGVKRACHANGQLWFKGMYTNGYYQGIWMTWYENGQKEEEGMYKNAKCEGVWMQWYKNGQKKFEGAFAGGERQGVFQWWDENGQKKFEGDFMHRHYTEDPFW